MTPTFVSVRALVSTVVELLGLAVVVFGVWLFDWRAAVLVGGIVVAFLGYVLDAIPTPPAKQAEK